MSIQYDPQIGSECPEEVQRFDERYYVRTTELSDGTVFFDDTNVFALVSPDTTVVGTEENPNQIVFDYEPAVYDSVEWSETKANGNTKFWLFDYEGNQIAVKYKYVEMVRDVFGLSLDKIRRNAYATVEEPDDSPRPIVVDSDDHEYVAMIMSHKKLSD